MIEEHLIQVEELTEVEAYEEHAEEEPSNYEFWVENFDFMPVGTTMEGNKIVDPRFPPLPEGPLGIPTLPSPTALGEMEEGQIPLLHKGELEVPPPSRIEEEMPILPILVVTNDTQEEQEHNGTQEGVQKE